MKNHIEAEELWELGKDLGDDMIEAGADPDRVAKAIAEHLDDLIPLDILVPGVPGMLLEAVDGPVFEKVVAALLSFFKVDPDRRAERRARRRSRRATRKAKRN